MIRIMIADDESILRKGIVNLINWSSLHCSIVYEASNGIDAKENLELTKPDIVITDIKMPRMNGIELAEYIYLNHPHIKIIFLTAYADFNFAQSAIKFGVTDFVIKSTDPIENVEKAIIKARDSILIQQEKDNKSTKARVENREILFKDILMGQLPNNQSLLDRMQSLDIELSLYYSLVFEMDSLVYNALSPQEQEHLSSSTLTFLALVFKDYKHYQVATAPLSFSVFLELSDAPDSNSEFDLISLCREFSSMVLSFLNIRINIGISRLHSTIEEIREAYRESLSALTGLFYNDNESVYIYGLNEDNFPEVLRESTYIDRIIQHIQSTDLTGAIDILNELMLKQNDSKQPVERIKRTGIMLCSLCSKQFDNYNLDQNSMAVVVADFYNKILLSKSINALIELLTNMLTITSAYLSSRENQSNYLINKAMIYIRENYKGRISLQQVADHVHVNSSYLSRLFSKETGNTLVEAINKFRIDKAKDLLATTQMKTFEVAAEVGFDDATYFIRLFKKYTNIRPQDFRRL